MNRPCDTCNKKSTCRSTGCDKFKAYIDADAEPILTVTDMSPRYRFNKFKNWKSKRPKQVEHYDFFDGDNI